MGIGDSFLPNEVLHHLDAVGFEKYFDSEDEFTAEHLLNVDSNVYP